MYMNHTISASDANRFHLTGEVVHGKHLGRKLGYPTANLVCPTDRPLPPDGVYIAAMQIHTGTYAGQQFPCVLNQGMQPTAPIGYATVEAHIPDFSGDLYGAQVTVTYLRFLRPETKFASLDALKAQLMQDTQTTRGYFAETGGANL